MKMFRNIIMHSCTKTRFPLSQSFTINGSSTDLEDGTHIYIEKIKEMAEKGTHTLYIDYEHIKEANDSLFDVLNKHYYKYSITLYSTFDSITDQLS